MSIKRFNEVFGIQADLENEKKRFVQRINQTIFSGLEGRPYPDDYERVFWNVCYLLGINADDLIAQANRINYGATIIPPLRKLPMTVNKTKMTMNPTPSLATLLLRAC